MIGKARGKEEEDIDGCDDCEGMKRLIWLNGVRIH